MASASANYGIQNTDEKAEYFDAPDDFNSKLDQLSQWVAQSKYLIVFTGAGISTSTGIPDFRSGMKTVLPTGPGVWELKDHGIGRSKAAKTKLTLQAIPSVTHMAIVELQRRGIIKYVISQNTDGLHLRSGLHSEAIAELHGNTNLEICEKCNERYLRDFRTRTSKKVHDHFTGRTCSIQTCKGRLKDSIINFGEDLPEKELSDAFIHAEKADLCICLGSSLRVSPANEIPTVIVAAGKRVVIGNLQKTPMDKKASLIINAMCDEIMAGLMQRLNIAIPKWELIRRVRLSLRLSLSQSADTMKLKVLLTALDIVKDVSYSIFKRVCFEVLSGDEKTAHEIEKEPFSFLKAIKVRNELNFSVSVSAEMFFHGHYGEPSFVVQGQLCNDRDSFNEVFLLFYDPSERKWRVGNEL